MTNEYKGNIEETQVPLTKETPYIKDGEEMQFQARVGEVEEKTIQNPKSITRTENNKTRRATVNITANYTFKRNSKGEGSLLIDKDSLAGELLIIGVSDNFGGSRSSDDTNLHLPLTLQKFKVSKNFKKLTYKAKTSSTNEKQISGKVSGVLRMQDTAILDRIDEKGQQASSNLRRKKSKIKVKLGPTVYKTNNSSATIALAGTQ